MLIRSVSAVTNAKRELIQDHMEHWLGEAKGGVSASTAIAEYKALANI